MAWKCSIWNHLNIDKSFRCQADRFLTTYWFSIQWYRHWYFRSKGYFCELCPVRCSSWPTITPKGSCLPRCMITVNKMSNRISGNPHVFGIGKSIGKEIGFPCFSFSRKWKSDVEKLFLFLLFQSISQSTPALDFMLQVRMRVHGIWSKKVFQLGIYYLLSVDSLYPMYLLSVCFPKILPIQV